MPSGPAERANEQPFSGMSGNPQPSYRGGGESLSPTESASLNDPAATTAFKEANGIPLPGGSFTALLNNLNLNDPAFNYTTADVGQTISERSGSGVAHAPIIAPSFVALHSSSVDPRLVGAPAPNSAATYETSSREAIPVPASDSERNEPEAEHVNDHPGMTLIIPTHIAENPNYFPARSDTHHFVQFNHNGRLVCSCGRAEATDVDFARHLGDEARRPWPCPVPGCRVELQQNAAYPGIPGVMKKVSTGGHLVRHVKNSSDGAHQAYCDEFTRELGKQLRRESKNLARALGII